MASQSKKLVLVALAVVALLSILGTDGETTFSLCRMTKEGFKSCQQSVDITSPQPPSDACCAAISGSDFQCLCHFKNSSLLKMYRVDPDLAMSLPRRCNLDGPSFRCQ